MDLNLGSLVARGEMEAVKLSLVAKRIERTEQIKRNPGNKKHEQSVEGVKEIASQS